MKFLFALLLMPLFANAASGPDAHVRREWNFTKQDYAKLRARGGELKFSERDEWMPAALRASIMSALNYALNPDLTPSSTNGINRLDFFHGHFVCTGLDRRIRDLGDVFNKDSNAIFTSAGFNQIDNPTKKNFPAFAKAVDTVDHMSSNLLNQLIPLCASTTVMFHSFEYITEKIGMSVNDARRHLYAPLGGGEVTRIEDHPVDPIEALAANFSLDLDKPMTYGFMFNFGFLIDKTGTIHLTQGSGFQLHRFTGERD